MPTNDQHLMDKLWNASYAITAFALAQGLSYLYALAKPEFQNAVKKESELVLLAILGCHVFYVFLIILCHAAINWACHIPWRTKFTVVNIGICVIQVLAVVLVGLLAIVATRALLHPEPSCTG